LTILTVCIETLAKLFRLDSHNEYYSHVFVIPLISGYLIYKKRNLLFFSPERFYASGIPLLAFGMTLFLSGRSVRENLVINDYVAIITLSALIMWIGGFIFLYGLNTFREAFFPFLFLLFMVPIPSILIDKIIYSLNIGSAWVTYILFKIAGIQFLKEGFVFHCPGIDIIIEKQCSGIRSTMGLLIPTVFSSYFFLNTGWKRALLVFAVFPVTVLKNGFRILVLSMIAIYLYPQHPFITFLHLHGGILFYIPAICFLASILILFIKSEQIK
jgi:exosortase